MYRPGHVGAGLLAYAPVAFVLLVLGERELAVVGGAVVVGLAMLPDVDQRLPFVRHRGPTHTVYFAVLVGVAVGAVADALGTAVPLEAGVGLGLFGFVVGTLAVGAHLAADALTPAGIDPFLTGRRYSLRVVRAANPIANYLLLAIGAAAAGGAYVAASGVA